LLAHVYDQSRILKLDWHRKSLSEKGPSSLLVRSAAFEDIPKNSTLDNLKSAGAGVRIDGPGVLITDNDMQD